MEALAREATEDEVARTRAVELILQRQAEFDRVAAATAELQRSNEALHERNATLTTYVDNLMYTVAAKDLALAPPATRSKGLHPLRRLAMLASVPERAPPEGGPPLGRAR